MCLLVKIYIFINSHLHLIRDYDVKLIITVNDTSLGTAPDAAPRTHAHSFRNRVNLLTSHTSETRRCRYPQKQPVNGGLFCWFTFLAHSLCCSHFSCKSLASAVPALLEGSDPDSNHLCVEAHVTGCLIATDQESSRDETGMMGWIRHKLPAAGG